MLGLSGSAAVFRIGGHVRAHRAPQDAEVVAIELHRETVRILANGPLGFPVARPARPDGFSQAFCGIGSRLRPIDGGRWAASCRS